MKEGDKFLIAAVALVFILIVFVYIMISSSGSSVENSSTNSDSNRDNVYSDNQNYNSNYNSNDDSSLVDDFLDKWKYDDVNNTNTTEFVNLSSNSSVVINFTQNASNVTIDGSSISLDYDTDLVLSISGDLSTESPVADWRVDGQSIALLNLPLSADSNDYSSYDFSVSVEGVTFSDGSSSFDGQNDYLLVSSNGVTSGKSEFSVSFWINPASTETTITIWEEAVGTYWQNTIRMDRWFTRDESTGTTGTRDNTLDLPDLELNSWSNLVFVYSVSRGVKEIYKNGVLEASTSVSVDPLTSERDGAWIGRPSDGSYFEGMLSDFVIYDRALFVEQISNIYSAGLKAHSVFDFVSEELVKGGNWSVFINDEFSGSQYVPSTYVPTDPVNPTDPVDECSSSSECPQGNSCQTGVCSSGSCTLIAKTSCVNNDGCCPSGCTYSDDTDCTQPSDPVEPSDPVDAVNDGTLKAFPGAIGYGAGTRGAYAGSATPKILIVDTLEWNKNLGSSSTGRGSLAWAINQDYPRIVLFEVSGTIDANRDGSGMNSYMTLAGQSAPSPGITVKDSTWGITNDEEIIIQHMRFRGSSENTDDLTLYKSSNIMVDHCSFSWGEDENIGITTGADGLVHPELTHITFSNNIIAEALNELRSGSEYTDSKGMLIMGGQNIAVVRNIFASNFDRAPLMRNGATNLYVVNNLIHNTNIHNIYFRDSFRPVYASVIGNILTRGPDTAETQIIVPSDDMDSGSEVYVSNNKDLSSSIWRTSPLDVIDVKFTPASFVQSVFTGSNQRIEFSDYSPVDAEDVPNLLYATAGARPKDRDAVDKRIIQEIKDGAGDIPMRHQVTWPNLAENTRPLSSVAGYPSDPHGDSDDDGYTNLEEWLYSESMNLIE